MFEYLIGVIATVAIIFSSVDSNNEDIQAENMKKQVQEVVKHSEIYLRENKAAKINTTMLLAQGMRPSELVVYDDEFSRKDGMLFDKYNEAVKIYLEGNPEGSPDCTALAGTGKIKLDECNYIENKEVSWIELSENGQVSFELRGEAGRRLAKRLGQDVNDNDDSILINNFNALVESKEARSLKNNRNLMLQHKITKHLQNNEFGAAAFVAQKLSRVNTDSVVQSALNNVAIRAKAYREAGNVLSEHEEKMLSENLTEGFLYILNRENNVTFNDATVEFVNLVDSETLEEKAKRVIVNTTNDDESDVLVKIIELINLFNQNFF